MEMKALVKAAPGPGQMALQQVPVPDLAPQEVLIRVRACGICGSDLKIHDDEHPNTPPVVVGHEFSGEVVKLGSAVAGWNVGDRVVSEQHTGACGRCRHCLSGNAFACPSKRSPGYFMDGAFAEFIKVPAWLLHRIPDNLNYVEAALSEPAAVAVHGVLERTGIAPDDVVLVLGCGPIGLIAALLAQLAGAATVIVTGIERDERARLPKARALGIQHAVNVSREDLPALVAELTRGEGVDVVIELSGAPAAIDQGFNLVRRLGRVGIIGQPPVDVLPIPYRQALFHALKVTFTFSSKYSSWERALSFFARGVLRPGELITHVLPLEEWQQGFALSRSGAAVKVVLEP